MIATQVVSVEVQLAHPMLLAPLGVALPGVRERTVCPPVVATTGTPTGDPATATGGVIGIGNVTHRRPSIE